VIFDFRIDCVAKPGVARRDVWSEARHYFSIAGYEEFLEVPEHFRRRCGLDSEFDKVLAQTGGVACGFRCALDQGVVERVPFHASDGDLRIHGEFDAETGLAEGLDLGVRARLLRAKIVGWKTADDETLVAILFIKRFEPLILRRETALRCDVDDQQNFALVFGKRSRRSVDTRYRDIEDWAGLTHTGLGSHKAL